MAGMMARKEERPESEGVTCIVDGRDNGGGGGARKELRVEFFLFFFLFFLFGLLLFSARSQQVWVWTAGERIDASFYSQNTLLHL